MTTAQEIAKEAAEAIQNQDNFWGVYTPDQRTDRIAALILSAAAKMVREANKGAPQCEKITDESQPKFPCWLWNTLPGVTPQWCHFSDRPVAWPGWWTHWTPVRSDKASPHFTPDILLSFPRWAYAAAEEIHPHGSERAKIETATTIANHALQSLRALTEHKGEPADQGPAPQPPGDPGN